MTLHITRHLPAVAAAAASAFAACAPATGTSGTTTSGAPATATAPSGPVTIREGFVAPEAVRYDPDQDIYLVNSWGQGSPGATDNNGYISRMRPDGTIENLRFIAGGTGGVTLHAPRGAIIVGDTLWVADADAVRGFHRRTGAPLATVDFSSLDPGFLNDLAADAEGRVYVTDTGRNKIYRVSGGPTLVANDSLLNSPNGITWDAANRRFIVVPYGGGHGILAWTPGGALTSLSMSTGAKYDGVEVLPGGRVLVASQADTSLHLFVGGTGRAIIRVGGPPADIAVDTRRNRVAVPIVALNRVEIWDLPK